MGTKEELTLFDDGEDLCILFMGEAIARVKREGIGFARKFVAAPDMYEALTAMHRAWVVRPDDEINALIYSMASKALAKGDNSPCLG